MDEQGVMVEFLHPHGPQKIFKWPRNPNRCLVPVQSILCTISGPVTTTGCLYKSSDGEFDNIVKWYDGLCNLLLQTVIRNVKFRNICCRVKQEFSNDIMKHMFTVTFIYFFFQLKNALSSNLNFKWSRREHSIIFLDKS